MVILVFFNVLKIAKVRPLVGQKGPYNPTTDSFVMFVFSNTFPLLREFTFPSELYGFLFHAKYVRNPYLWTEYLCFPIIFTYYGEFNFPMFWKLYGFLPHAKYLRNT